MLWITTHSNLKLPFALSFRPVHFEAVKVEWREQKREWKWKKKISSQRTSALRWANATSALNSSWSLYTTICCKIFVSHSLYTITSTKQLVKCILNCLLQKCCKRMKKMLNEFSLHFRTNQETQFFIVFFCFLFLSIFSE